MIKPKKYSDTWLSSVKTRITYDPKTGVFTWIGMVAGPKKRDGRAGYINCSGYRYICINRKTIAAHRLAWLFVRGNPLPPEIDHFNGIKDDNRIVNLRAATRSINNQGTKTSGASSKFIGVCFDCTRQRWKIRVVHSSGVLQRRFLSEIEAANAYDLHAKILIGASARLNFQRNANV